MNRPTTTAMLLIVAITLALIPASTPAQRLYNKERDEQAQAALPLAQALKTGELFDRQLNILSSLAKKDFDTEFLVTRFQSSHFRFIGYADDDRIKNKLWIIFSYSNEKLRDIITNKTIRMI